jgi:hypothetical protein
VTRKPAVARVVGEIFVGLNLTWLGKYSQNVMAKALGTLTEDFI